ncbi:hypothetical protein MCY_00944 [Bartonella rattimassiliensis 15908]|uniref:Uncharacterized protein n=1 Tax=Bartonella rattimassiliensis 15908 TaxID=1094556 RepID=J0ZBU1_9HYPH|nr:hypothetical protein MCY_00944 [Bartonella rattimassiliensis 15908]
MPNHAGNLALKANNCEDLGNDEALGAREFSQHLHKALRRLSVCDERREVSKSPDVRERIGGFLREPVLYRVRL